MHTIQRPNTDNQQQEARNTSSTAAAAMRSTGCCSMGVIPQLSSPKQRKDVARSEQSRLYDYGTRQHFTPLERPQTPPYTNSK